jgi:hypothetical protein
MGLSNLARVSVVAFILLPGGTFGFRFKFVR